MTRTGKGGVARREGLTMARRSAPKKLDFVSDKPERPQRAMDLFHCARDIVLKKGISGPLGVIAAVGSVTIHIATRAPRKETSDHLMPAAAGKWLPYNLRVFERTGLVLSINYNVADEIEVVVFRRGRWEDRLFSPNTSDDV